MASRCATGVNISPKSWPSTWLYPCAIRQALFLTTSPSSPCLFLNTYLVSITLTPRGGSAKVQTWFLSKFSNSSSMALTQLESESACITSRGSNRATNNVLVNLDRCADLEDHVTLSFKLPMICLSWMCLLNVGWSSLLGVDLPLNPWCLHYCCGRGSSLRSLCFKYGSKNKIGWWCRRK
jgi:hypothetical protein